MTYDAFSQYDWIKIYNPEEWRDLEENYQLDPEREIWSLSDHNQICKEYALEIDHVSTGPEVVRLAWLVGCQLILIHHKEN